MKNWSLNAKILLIVGIFSIASITISVIGVRGLTTLDSTLGLIVNEKAKRLERAMDIKAMFLLQAINEKSYILASTKEERDETKSRLESRHEELNKKWLEAHMASGKKGKEDYEKFKVIYESWWRVSAETMKLASLGSVKEAIELSASRGRELRLEAEKVLDGAVDRNRKLMVEAKAQGDADSHRASLLLIWISVGAIATGFIASLFIMRAVGRSINHVISNLSSNSDQVTSAAQQIASASEELSQATTEQAAALEETAASIEEMNSMVQKNAENARRAFGAAESSRDSAAKGKVVVDDMMKAIDDINVSNSSIMESINESNRKISEIVQVISEIGNKTKVINDIVFQTKLLSFNASVEAARAGEHGKGFAVVAEEVGNLAQMSGNAAKEISSMLDGSIQKVQTIVDDTKRKVELLIQDGKSKVDAGTRIARECGSVLDEIVENVTGVTRMANEISTASQEQAQGVQEITKAMSQLDHTTQTNAATSEEAASAAEQLSAQAESLRSLVGVLVQTIRGTQSSKQEPAPVKKAAQVIPIRESKPTQVYQLKKPQALESSIPSDDDPRFKEV